jgi:hypothetical protein
MLAVLLLHGVTLSTTVAPASAETLRFHTSDKLCVSYRVAWMLR